MTAYAILDGNGYVIARNTYPTDPGPPWIEVPSYVDGGWQWDGTNWIEPRPVELEMLKLEGYLADENLLDSFQEVLNQATPKATKQRWLSQWKRLDIIPRDHDMIVYIADELGLTQAQMDNLFRAAAQLP